VTLGNTETWVTRALLPPTVSGPPAQTSAPVFWMQAERRKAIHDAIVRLSDGDRSAMVGLVEHLWPVLLDFARRGLRHDEDAEDVAQEVFVRICSRASEFDRTRDGLSWAFGIASYEVMTARRRTQRRRETFDESVLEAQSAFQPSQEDALVRADLEAALEHVLGGLSQDDRAHLGLVTTASHSVTGATMRKRRQRALERLRTMWRRVYGEP
jgi:RNA polymerase sigma-70 factor (ECF subfamily)